MAELIPPEKRAVLVELISGGRKIEAIKFLREQTGLALEEAKDEIDALEARIRSSTADNVAAVDAIDSSLTGNAMLSQDNLTALSELIFQERKVEAIKRYREWNRVDLKEAKHQVEALEAALRIKTPEKFASRQRKGCFAAIVGICALTLICWIARA